MRHTLWHDQHVALGKLMRGAAFDRAGTELTGSDLARVEHFPTGDDDGRRSCDDVHDVGDALVVLHLAGCGPAAGVHLVVGAVEQQAAGLELRLETVRRT
jgi:hypothetical protein